MIRKAMALNGDSGNPALKKAAGSGYKPNTNGNPYEKVEIQRSVGKPSVSRQEITKAVRSVMREDGLLKS